VALLAVLGGGAACGGDDDDAETVGAGSVLRLELADAEAADAPGRHLYLQEVTIGPDTRLSTHYHDGIQIATIRSGTLTYHMLEGSVEITRADGTTETVAAPAVTELEPGDAVVEPVDAVHFGENAGDEPVVITLAALVAADAEIATVVDDPD
jgi:quercetin dioxygenase-like cupin family protein